MLTSRVLAKVVLSVHLVHVILAQEEREMMMMMMMIGMLIIMAMIERMLDNMTKVNKH